MTQNEPTAQRRNKCFDDSHQQMIETAVRLISEKGIDSLSIAALARALGINRTTVYYHFDSREALITAVKLWSSEQLAKAFGSGAPQQERIDYISRFVLSNPELIKLWFEDFISIGDIRDRYPHWDALVEGVGARAAAEGADETVDAEVYCTILLTSAFIAPRVFRNSVCPKDDTETVVRRFRREHQRLLKYVSLLKP
jgi:AcrR family transcriptional regulator